ncbi:hypothetical protein ACFLY5_00185 [Patescibacteria group bacterium]
MKRRKAKVLVVLVLLILVAEASIASSISISVKVKPLSVAQNEKRFGGYFVIFAETNDGKRMLAKTEGGANFHATAEALIEQAIAEKVEVVLYGYFYHPRIFRIKKLSVFGFNLTVPYRLP